MDKRDQAIMDEPLASRNIFTSYVDCFKKYAKFSGRASRFEYWSFVLVNFFAGIVAYFLGPLYYVYAVAVILPSWAVTSRRMHDINKSFWWATAPIVLMLAFGLFGGLLQYNGIDATRFKALGGIVGFLSVFYSFVLLFWLCTKGDRKPNKYGNPSR